jgi:hypothetical protein
MTDDQLGSTPTQFYVMIDLGHGFHHEIDWSTSPPLCPWLGDQIATEIHVSIVQSCRR